MDRWHAKGDTLHRVFEDDHAEVVRIRCGAPVVIRMAVVSTHREAYRASANTFGAKLIRSDSRGMRPP